MILHVRSIDDILSYSEKELINKLYEHECLCNFTSDSKILIRDFIYLKVFEFLEKRHHYVVFSDNIRDSHEICCYYNKDLLQKFIKCILLQISKICNKILYLRNTDISPKIFHSEIDGELMDQMNLASRRRPPSIKEFDKFLSKNYLEPFRRVLSKIIY